MREWITVAESAWGKQYKCSICNIRTTAYSYFCPMCGSHDGRGRADGDGEIERGDF